MPPPNSRKWIRAGEVLELTKWSKKYLESLREREVLRTWKPYASAWTWYDRDQILQILQTGSSTESKP